MKKGTTVREMEIATAAARPLRHQKAILPLGEAMAMLARRGLRPSKARLDLPFPENLDEEKGDQLAQLLGRYAFRLFLRGAIQRPEGFAPEEVTQYLKKGQSKAYAESLVKQGLAARISPGRYRLLRTAKSFGGTLEWYVGRELRRQPAASIAFHRPPGTCQFALRADRGGRGAALPSSYNQQVELARGCSAQECVRAGRQTSQHWPGRHNIRSHFPLFPALGGNRDGAPTKRGGGPLNPLRGAD